MTSFQAKKVGKVREREKIEIFTPTRCVIENSNKMAKKLKKLKNIVVAPIQAKIGWKRLKKIENKNYRSVLFPPDA